MVNGIGVTGEPDGRPSSCSLRTSHTGTSSSVVRVRSPPIISAGSALKLPESARMTQLRVWLTVWMEPPNETPSRGQCRTSVPPSKRTTEGCMPKVGSITGCSFTVQRQSRSGSTTGWAVENRNGIGPGMGSDEPPQLSMWPTSATYSSVPGCSSTGRPASQVV